MVPCFTAFHWMTKYLASVHPGCGAVTITDISGETSHMWTQAHTLHPVPQFEGLEGKPQDFPVCARQCVRQSAVPLYGWGYSIPGASAAVDIAKASAYCFSHFDVVQHHMPLHKDRTNLLQEASICECLHYLELASLAIHAEQGHIINTQGVPNVNHRPNADNLGGGCMLWVGPVPCLCSFKVWQPIHKIELVIC